MINQYTEQPWEKTLLSLAYQANKSISRAPLSAGDGLSKALKVAYGKCETITARHSRSFYLATALLPVQKRRAVRALYAFCRMSDDIVDRGREEVDATLKRWRGRSLAPQPDPEDSVAFAWGDARTRYRIPLHYAEQLLDGVERDLRQKRYESFDELAVYCYGVASTVGLMSMHIIGFQRPEAISYAVKLGVALQMTNILRDVGEDWRAGRLYLPLNELEAFNLGEEDVAEQRVDERWREFMRFQIARNRNLYTEAWPGINLLHPDGRFAVSAAAYLYRSILDDIEAHDYDVFRRRAHVKDLAKVQLLLRAYRKSRSGLIGYRWKSPGR